MVFSTPGVALMARTRFPLKLASLDLIDVDLRTGMMQRPDMWGHLKAGESLQELGKVSGEEHVSGPQRFAFTLALVG